MNTALTLEEKEPMSIPRAASTVSAGRGSGILLLTPYTGGNLGDAAIQDAVIHHLQKRLTGPVIRLITLAPRVTSARHGLPSFPIASSVNDEAPPTPESHTLPSLENGTASVRHKARIKNRLKRVRGLYRCVSFVAWLIRLVASLVRGVRNEICHLFRAYRLLKESDSLIMSGGGQIDDLWGGAFGHPYAMLKWTCLARLANVRVVFLSVGVCSLTSRLGSCFARWALHLAAYRSYRDPGSKELLRDAIFTRNDPEFPDLAFSHPCTQQREFVARDSSRKHLVIGISPIIYLSSHGWPQREAAAYERYLDLLGDFTASVLEAGQTVVLFTSAQMDQSAVKDLQARLSQNPMSKSWGSRLRQVDQASVDNQLEEIRKMDLVVASRLHGIILSHLLGKPVLAISYDRKVEAHMASMAQERFCLNLRESTPAQLWCGFTNLALQSAAVSAAIRSRVEEFGGQLDQQYARVVQLMTRPRRMGTNAIATDDFANLDFMRSCAVLFVLGFHLLLFFRISPAGPLDFHQIGQWGVLVFFVHTSFVLTLQLERQSLLAPGQRLFWPFLVRRIFRILPLSIFVICVVEWCGLPVGHLRDGHFIPVQLDASGLLSNIFLVQNVTHHESATAPLWSLPYEMQMYLLLPALFLLGSSARGVLAIFGLWLAGFLAMRYAGGIARYGLPDLLMYVPYFVPGVIAGKLMSVSEVRLPSSIWPAALAGITGYYLLRPSDTGGAICCLLLGMAIPQFRQISQPVVVKLSQLIARYSYGIYLTHFFCIWLAFQALNSLPKPGQWVVFLVTVWSIPFVLYHVIEAPMIQCGRRIAARLIEPPVAACGMKQ